MVSKTDQAMWDNIDFMHKMLRYQLYAVFGLMAIVWLAYIVLEFTPIGTWVEKKRQENIERIRREKEAR